MDNELETVLEIGREDGVKCFASQRNDRVERTRRNGGVLDTNTDVWVHVEDYGSSLLTVPIFSVSEARPSAGVRRAEEVGWFPERWY